MQKSLLIMGCKPTRRNGRIVFPAGAYRITLDEFGDSSTIVYIGTRADPTTDDEFNTDEFSYDPRTVSRVHLLNSYIVIGEECDLFLLKIQLK